MAKMNEIDREKLKIWLQKQPVDVAVVLAVRAVLRTIPTFSRVFGVKGWGARKTADIIILPFMRAVSAQWSLAAQVDYSDEMLARVVHRGRSGLERSRSQITGGVERKINDFLIAADLSAVTFQFARDHAIADAAEKAAQSIKLASSVDIENASLAVAADREALEEGIEAYRLAATPLWPKSISNTLKSEWELVRRALESLDEGWEVWIDWYEARVNGEAFDPVREHKRATLSDSIWEKGVAAANAEIRSLTERPENAGATSIDTIEDEIAKLLSETSGKADADTSSSNVTVDSIEEEMARLINEIEIKNHAGTENANVRQKLENSIPSKLEIKQAPQSSETQALPPADLPNVWILQYRPEDRVTRWTGEATPGSTIRWKTEKALPKAMRDGDPVVYWRTIHPKNKKDRGGLVGTGMVISTDAEDENGILRFPTEVRDFNEDNRIDRDEVIGHAGITRGNWRGAVLDLPREQALKLNELLLLNGREGLFTPEMLGASSSAEEQAVPPQPDHFARDLRVVRDDAERDRDGLGRGLLAVSFATTLHQIWCAEQGLEPYPDHAPRRDAPGFVAHVDAPWGGGKTSFANLVARTLNPHLDGRTGWFYNSYKIPEFLKTIYFDREDMSGVFIPGTAEKHVLKGTDDRYQWAGDARRPWIVVPFNAWENHHVDPPWWSFYQAILHGCGWAMYREGIPTVRQKKDGGYATSYEFWPKRLWHCSALWWRELWWRFWTPAMRNSVIVFVLTVGAAYALQYFDLFDVKTLTAIFNTAAPVENVAKPPSPSPDEPVSLGFKFLATAILVLLGGAAALKTLFAGFTRTLLPGTPEAAKNYSLGSADPLERFRRHFASMMERIRRPVLVIIDDIDRCEPKFIVEMTRGLQTILKSPRVAYLILGDRSWIEQAFEVHHAKMEAIDVGPEHTFGGRFVEKAIQLTFVLPGMGANRKSYVESVLGVTPDIEVIAEEEVLAAAEETAEQPFIEAGGVPREQEDGDSGVDAVKGKEAGAAAGEAAKRAMVRAKDIQSAERKRIRDLFAAAPTIESMDALADAQLNARKGDESFQRVVREEIVLRRTARKKEVEKKIGESLRPLAPFLPGNPRHIKRIINAIALYQDSLMLVGEAVVQGAQSPQIERPANDGEARKKTESGGQYWRELVIGVVLMMSYPKSWGLLASHPDWADLLIAGEKGLGDGSGTPGSTPSDVDEAYAKLAANKDLVTLLSKTQLREKPDGPPVSTTIDADAIEWLSRFIPIAAG